MKSLWMLLVTVLLASYSFQTASADGHKIVVIADPHVTAASLVTNPNNSDWETCLNSDRKLLDYSLALFEQAVTEITTTKPELVLIVGDLTKDGEEASHNYLKGKLDALKAAGIKTLVIPGNHDLGTAEAKVYGETTTTATIVDKDGFVALYKDYGYDDEVSEFYGNMLTYACEPIEGLVVIGIDTGEDGTIKPDMLMWVCEKATTARTQGKQVVAMMHHPLIPHITGGDAFVETVSVNNYEDVRNCLANAGISVVFTGHFHTSDIARDWNEDKSQTIYDVTTGSLSSYPCDYRVVTLNNALTSMEISTKSITSAGAPIGGGENFTTDIAKERLTKSMKSVITAKLNAKGYGALASLVATPLTNAYIFHAEGDENKSTGENSAASCLSTLQSSLSLAKTLGSINEAQYAAFSAMLNSMLQNKSNYGVEGREDQTSDRDLTVAMPKTSVAASVTHEGTVSYFETLAAAFDAAVNLDEVTLLADTDLGASSLVIGNGTDGKTLTLNLNGKTLSRTGNGSLIIVQPAAALTLKDSKGGGKVSAENVVIMNKGTLDIQSGIIASNNQTGIVSEGDLGLGALNCFSGNACDIKLVESETMLGIIGIPDGIAIPETITKVKLDVESTTMPYPFTAGYGPLVEELEQPIYPDQIFTYCGSLEGGRIVLSGEDREGIIVDKNYVPKVLVSRPVGENVTTSIYHNTLVAALGYARNGDVIQPMIDLVGEDEAMVENMLFGNGEDAVDATLDLNGKTIESTASFLIQIQPKASLTISDGKGGGKIIAATGIINKGALTLNALPEFECTGGAICLDKDKVINFGKAISTCPENPIRVITSNENAKPYIFTSGYSEYVKGENGVLLEPDKVFANAAADDNKPMLSYYGQEVMMADINTMGFIVTLAEGYDAQAKSFEVIAVSGQQETDITQEVVGKTCQPIAKGTTIKLVITPKDGYFVESVTTNISGCTVTEGENDTWTTAMPQANVEFTVVYAESAVSTNPEDMIIDENGHKYISLAPSAADAIVKTNKPKHIDKAFTLSILIPDDFTPEDMMKKVKYKVKTLTISQNAFKGSKIKKLVFRGSNVKAMKTVKVKANTKAQMSKKEIKKFKKLLLKQGFSGKVIRLSRAAEDDDEELVELDPDAEYQVLEDCDLDFIIPIDENSDEDIEIESFIHRMPGDANNDDKVDAADIVEMVNAKEGKPTSENFSKLNADITDEGDGEVDQDDIDVAVKLVMGIKDEEE